MYKTFIRPLLFLFPPETAHKITVTLMRLVHLIPGLKQIIGKIFSYHSERLSININGLSFKNRVGLAAGFDKNADFYNDISVFGFSFIEIGTITPVPQPGNQRPRLFRLKNDGALINRMGFNNKGVNHAVEQLRKRDNSIIIGGNIGKNTLTSNKDAAKDYALCFERLYDVVDYFTINVSCPNIKGMEKLQDYESIAGIVKEVMKIRSSKEIHKPVFLKISPDLPFEQIDDMLSLYHIVGLDGIIAANTTTSRQGLSLNELQIDAIGSGGLSGKPLKNKVKEIIVYICKQSSTKIPVIAAGGIMSADDALEMIEAGACLVQIYTGFIYEGPFLVKRINKRLDQYYRQQK